MKFQICINIFLNTRSEPHSLLNVAGLVDVSSWRITLLKTISNEVTLATPPAIVSSYGKVREPCLLLLSNKTCKRKTQYAGQTPERSAATQYL